MKLGTLSRTVYWFVVFWLFLILTVFYGFYVIFLALPPLKRFQPAALAFVGHRWGKVSLWASGSQLTIIGAENIPKDHTYCVVANHQSTFDIPILMAIFPWTLGFVAKKELRFFPIIGYWMSMMGCVFLDRKNRRLARVALEKGAERIKKGQPMVIFPEGTRGKEGQLLPFKPGSLKMPIMSQTKIIPVTIDGTYKIYEKNNRLIVPAHVRYTIHAPLSVEGMTPDMTTELAKKLKEIITGGLSQ